MWQGESVRIAGSKARYARLPEQEHALKTNFLNEKCTAQDVAALVNFLASDEGRFITGQNYIIDGGRCLAMKGSD